MGCKPCLKAASVDAKREKGKMLRKGERGSEIELQRERKKIKGREVG